MVVVVGGFRDNHKNNIYIYIYIYLFLFSAASRGSATAQLNRIFINYIAKHNRTPSGEAFEIIAKSILKRCRINKKRPSNDAGAVNAILGGVAARPRNHDSGLYFGSQNRKRGIRNAINKSY